MFFTGQALADPAGWLRPAGAPGLSGAAQPGTGRPSGADGQTCGGWRGGHRSGQGATVWQPYSSGATSRTVSVNCQRWPARSSTLSLHSPPRGRGHAGFPDVAEGPATRPGSQPCACPARWWTAARDGVLDGRPPRHRRPEAAIRWPRPGSHGSCAGPQSRKTRRTSMPARPETATAPPWTAAPNGSSRVPVYNKTVTGAACWALISPRVSIRGAGPGRCPGPGGPAGVRAARLTRVPGRDRWEDRR
jgi:hypothetical protein